MHTDEKVFYHRVLGVRAAVLQCPRLEIPQLCECVVAHVCVGRDAFSVNVFAAWFLNILHERLQIRVRFFDILLLCLMEHVCRFPTI